MKDGGPAFPAPEWFESAIEGETGKFMYDHPGMTLRDWFAGQAPPMPTRISYTTHNYGPDEILRIQAAEEAKWGYIYADAVLAAREEKS